MAFDVVGDSFTKRNNAVPSTLFPAHPAMVVPETRRSGPAPSTWCASTASGRSTGRPGTTWWPAGSPRCWPIPSVGDVEIWELRNPSGGWHHPLHVHFVDFRILSRNGRPPLPYEVGPKDVAFLGENETVQVLIKFEGGGASTWCTATTWSTRTTT